MQHLSESAQVEEETRNQRWHQELQSSSFHTGTGSLKICYFVKIHFKHALLHEVRLDYSTLNRLNLLILTVPFFNYCSFFWHIRSVFVFNPKALDILMPGYSEAWWHPDPLHHVFLKTLASSDLNSTHALHDLAGWCPPIKTESPWNSPRSSLYISHTWTC